MTMIRMGPMHLRSKRTLGGVPLVILAHLMDRHPYLRQARIVHITWVMMGI